MGLLLYCYICYNRCFITENYGRVTPTILKFLFQIAHRMEILFFFLSSFSFNAALGAFLKILVSLSVSSTAECFLLLQTHTVRSLVCTC